ncbi:MAG: hypothetical protein HGA44_02110 [Cellulomonadaceae bacterium]|nr:hypothetical protein [Cellulomonadaceae bacterium]
MSAAGLPARCRNMMAMYGSNWSTKVARDLAASGHPVFNVRFRFDSLSEYAAMAPPRLALLRSYLGERWPAAARRYAATHVFLDPALRFDQAELYAGDRPGTTTSDVQRLAELEREVRELRWANTILRSASVLLGAELYRPSTR